MKKIIRLFIFIFIATVIIGGAYKILSWKDTTGDYQSVTQQLYATEDNLIDVVFMGSSHCYCSINPSQLWEEYGISAFDMAISGEDKESTYYSLVELLKTQTPEVVFVDMYGLLYNGYEIKGNEYRNMLALKTSETSAKLVEAVIDEDEQLDYLLRWPIVHTRYKELAKYDFKQNEYSEFGRGFSGTYEVGWVARPYQAIECEWSSALTVTNREWLNRLKTLSEENDFQLVFFVAPFNATMQEQKVMNSAAEYADRNKIDFIDCNKLWDELKLDETTDFCDQFHTNVLGAKKVTAYMGEYLAKNYKLKNHKNDTAYELWNQCAEYEKHLDEAYKVQQIEDMQKELSYISKMKDVTVVLSLDGHYTESTLDFANALNQSFKISKDDYLNGGMWIFTNGTKEYFLSPDAEEQYIKEFKYDSLAIQNVVTHGNTDEAIFNKITINKEAYGSMFNGLSIVVYDDILHKVILKTGYY